MKLRSIFIILFYFGIILFANAQTKKSLREHGIIIGVLKTGEKNSITDVKGVKVGQTTIISGTNIRTGVTAVLPHDGNLFQQKVPAAIYIGNGFGKLSGISQVQELGNLETPIILTNTLSVSTAMDAVIDYTLSQKGNETVQSVNAVVGETNDGWLNDIRGRHVTKDHVLKAIATANADRVQQGNVGAGTGTICFGYKGGIGSSSRVLPKASGGYTVGVLVQTNFGGVLEINGTHFGKLKGKYFLSDQLKDSADGSCMIVIATDAPVDARNLERMAKRAMMGLAKTGGIASNGSGDYVIAFTIDPGLLIAHQSTDKMQQANLLTNDEMSPLFLAVIEATEEAIINSLFAAESMTGKDGRKIEALPVDDLLKVIHKD
jgi:D-aminopeptidase